MDDVSPYLYSLAMRAATHVGSGHHASITFRHRGMLVRAASSDDQSARCDQVEVRRDDGPCVEALDRGTTILVRDLGSDPRWPEWRARARAEGFRSAVAVPAHVGPGIVVALNLYAEQPDPWDDRALADAGTYARRIATAIGVRVHFATPDPPQAYASLTGSQIVDRAVRAVMQCNGCGPDEALDILVSASTHRNVDLVHVATTVLLALTGADAGAEGAAPVAGEDRARRHEASR